MSTTFGSGKLAQPGWTQRAGRLFDRFRDAFRERRRRALLRSALSGLDDRELHDIGIARGEIDFAAAGAAAGFDPRHVGAPAAHIRGGG
jgi:uncharacterized protein YjiS (DUF1127 family)